MDEVVDLLRDILDELRTLNAKIDALQDLDSTISEARASICDEIESVKGGFYTLSDIYSKTDDILDRM